MVLIENDANKKKTVGIYTYMIHILLEYLSLSYSVNIAGNCLLVPQDETAKKCNIVIFRQRV